MCFRIFLLFFVLFTTSLLPAELTLKSRLEKAKAGDYIVYSQGNYSSLLFIRAIDPHTLFLEEVVFPSAQKSSISSWQQWLSTGAPESTSWDLYTFNIQKGEVLQHFSYTRNCFLSSDGNETNLLAKLLLLRLTITPESELKKIGPAPSSNEPDYRKIWLPSIYNQGILVKDPQLKAFHTQWPKDQSPLAGCRIELYLSSFTPFPIWMEIQSPHYALKIHTLDCGRGLASSKDLPSWFLERHTPQ